MTDMREILADRRSTHGDFTDNAKIMQQLKHIMRTGNNWGSNSMTPVHREALEMIAHKIGRILTGDPNVHEHWDDIAGYALLVSQRIPYETDNPTR